MKGKKNIATRRKEKQVLGKDTVEKKISWSLKDETHEQNKTADLNKRLKGQKDNQEEDMREVLVANLK